jgi:DNA-binding CsgD family transcriptional regulator
MKTALIRALPVVYFSPRERQVFDPFCDAVQPKQIAAMLAISPEAVYFHLTGLRRKLHLADNAELFLWGVQHAHDRSVGLTRDFTVHRSGCICAGNACAMDVQRAA